MPEPGFLQQLGQFHFLRPWWLVGLLIIPLLYLLLRRLRRNTSSWITLIDPRLLEHLLESKPSTRQSTSIAWALTLPMLAFLALAGPAWKQIPQPVHQAQDALVVALDLSLSMQVEDLKPSRLVKARHKLLDILDSREDGLTALLVYAGDAHVVSPLTDDTETIKAMVPALSPLIMPAMGSDPVAAMNLALQLLQDAGINDGRILLMSDGVEFNQTEEIADALSSSLHELSVLSIGTADGGPIPLPQQGFLKQRGEIVIARAGLPQLQTLAKLSNGRYSTLQLTDADINHLLGERLPDFNRETREVERNFDQWREEGPWLLLLLAPLAALGFRRGWVFSLALTLTLQPEPAYAFDWQDLWRTRDQQGAIAAERGEHARAAELFESPMHRGSAQYRAGNYEAAINDYQSLDSVTGHYNRGNALARAGKIAEAIAAYDKTLAADPGHEDALFNKSLLEQLQQQQQQQQNGDGENSEQQEQQQSGQQSQQESQQESQQSNENQQQDSGEQQQEQQNANSSNQDSSQSENGSDPRQQEGQQSAQQNNEESRGNPQQPAEQQPPQSGEENSQEHAQEDRAQPESRESEQSQPATAAELDAEQLDAEQLQAMEQWLRRIPDDPGGLLRRKFDYQYRQRQLDNQFEPQTEGKALW